MKNIKLLMVGCLVAAQGQQVKGMFSWLSSSKPLDQTVIHPDQITFEDNTGQTIPATIYPSIVQFILDENAKKSSFSSSSSSSSSSSGSDSFSSKYGISHKASLLANSSLPRTSLPDYVKTISFQGKDYISTNQLLALITCADREIKRRQEDGNTIELYTAKNINRKINLLKWFAWGHAITGTSTTIGTYSPNLEKIAQEVAPLFTRCPKVGEGEKNTANDRYAELRNLYERQSDKEVDVKCDKIMQFGDNVVLMKELEKKYKAVRNDAICTVASAVTVSAGIAYALHRCWK